MDKSIPRRKVSEDQLAHLSEIHRMVAELYIADHRWELVETTPASAGGRKKSK
ncbi:MAG: hypothetical protein WBL42_01850 [Methanoregula sp.]